MGETITGSAKVRCRSLALATSVQIPWVWAESAMAPLVFKEHLSQLKDIEVTGIRC